MTFTQSIKTCFSKYATFTGRASRSEFWWFNDFCLFGWFATFIVGGGMLGWLWVIALVPWLAVAVRRLHDIGRSGGWLFIALTGIGIIPLIIMGCLPSQKNANKYGDSGLVKQCLCITTQSKLLIFGILKWKDAKTNPPECRDANGEKQGRWEERLAVGAVFTGDYVDGKRQGRWEIRDAKGYVATGGYVDGKEQGRWEERETDGRVITGDYKDGKEHGQWEVRDSDGNVGIGDYKDGKPHGRWEDRKADGGVATGEMVDGKKQGQWEERLPDGRVQIGDYVDGKYHGSWEVRHANGSVQYVNFIYGERQK